MATITPIIAQYDTIENTTSTSYVDTSCETVALDNGVNYFVRYYGNVGSNNTSDVPKMRLLHGAAVVGEVGAEGRGNSANNDSTQCQGYAYVTGDGSSTLKFQFMTSGNTAYVGAMIIAATPLTLLTSTSDYWYSGTDSASNEVTDASASWETLRSQAFTLPDAGNYLVLMSCEAQASSNGGTSDAHMTRFYVGSTELCPTDSAGVGYLQEWEDDTDWDGISMATIVNLSSGSNTFTIECASRGSLSNFRRSRIWVFRCASFTKIEQTQDTNGATTSSSSFVDFSGLDTTFTPTQTAYVMILSHVIMRLSTLYAAVGQLYNNSDSLAYRPDSGEYNNDYGFDSNADIVPTVMTHCGQYSTAKAWRTQYRAESGTAAIGRNRNDDGGVESNMIFWELATAEEAVSHASGQLGCNW